MLLKNKAANIGLYSGLAVAYIAIVISAGCGGGGGNGIVSNSLSSRDAAVVDGSTIFKEVPGDTTFKEVRGVRAATTTATFTADSDPQGASIIVNGSDTGKTTPATFTEPAGTVTVKLTKSGYKDFSITLKAVAGATYSGKIKLQPINTPTTATLIIDSVPQGAEIFVNGSDTGKATPATVTAPAGMVTVKLTLSGYKDFSISLQTKAGATYQGKIKLVPVGGGSAINVADYFPLCLGSQWNYGSETDTVIKQVTINGKPAMQIAQSGSISTSYN